MIWNMTIFDKIDYTEIEPALGGGISINKQIWKFIKWVKPGSFLYVETNLNSISYLTW